MPPKRRLEDEIATVVQLLPAVLNSQNQLMALLAQQHQQPQQQPPIQQPVQNIMVRTEESQRDAERWIMRGGIKYPRTPLAPYSSLYAHIWCDGASYDLWLRESQDLLLGANIPAKYMHRYQKTCAQVKYWFELTATFRNLNQPIPDAHFKSFQATIEQFLELYLLCNRDLPANPEKTTALFWEEVDKAWHNLSSGIDYFKALSEARSAKTSNQQGQKNAYGRV